MAACQVSKPGDPYGPCKDDCEHIDCKASRDTAACVCRFCGKPIGYEVWYYDEWYDQSEEVKRERGRYAFFVHETCLMKSVGRW